MSMQYERFLKVLEKWPIDKSKSGRDLGVQIRQHINILTNPSRITSSEYDNYCKQFDSLEKLANNAFGGKCNRIYESSSTGLTVQQCSHVLSSEFLQYLKDKPKQL